MDAKRSNLWLTIGIGVFFAIVTMTSIWAARPKYTSYEDLYKSYEVLDPKPGKSIPIRERLPKDAQAEVLVLLLGNCQSCSISSLRLNEIDRKRWKSVVAVASSAQIDAKVLPIDFPCLRVVDDTEIHAALNAYWTPRMAVLTSKGSLIDLQKREESPYAFLERNSK